VFQTQKQRYGTPTITALTSTLFAEERASLKRKQFKKKTKTNKAKNNNEFMNKLAASHHLCRNCLVLFIIYFYTIVANRKLYTL